MTTGVLEVLDQTGDTKHEWDSANEAEVSAARAVFDALKAKRHAIFNLSENGARGRPMDRFDPNAQRLIAVPQMVGG